MTKEKINFIHKNEKKTAIFVALLTLFIINTFSAHHLIKLSMSFSMCLKNQVHI